MSEKHQRDVEEVYATSKFVAMLRRLAKALEADERFEIQVAGERVYVPAGANFNVEHERKGDEEEIESNSSGTTQLLENGDTRELAFALIGLF